MTGEFAPLKVAVVWLAGTFGLFLVVGQVAEVRDLFRLTAYVLATIACLVVGYWLRIVRYRSVPELTRAPETDVRLGTIRALVAASAVYYVAYGLVYMGQFGVRSPSAVVNAVLNPGSAYLAKFDVFASQVANDTTSTAAQLLTIAAVFSAPLVPFLIVYWRHLSTGLRLLALVGIATYAALFVAIGTLVGLGNVLIFAVVGFMIARARGQRLGTKRSRRALLLLAVLAVAFAGYMTYNQSARIQDVGIAGKYEPNPIARAVVGDDLARGVTVMAFYPTHGYQGLSYNLEQPFEWTHGRGAARALDSYLAQYGFGDSVSRDTYPQRTEYRTGWDAGINWSTIYPWLASDLTWAGAALFMVLIGWWLARWWYEATVLGSRIAMLLFAQIAVLVAYVPANNQLGLSRPNLICVATLLVVYALGSVRRPRGRSPAGLGSRPVRQRVP